MPNNDSSPYDGIDTDKWLDVTKKLVQDHPLSEKRIVEVCLESWGAIFNSKIGGVIQIGEEVHLTPQMMGNFLHILIAHYLSKESPELWRKEIDTGDKDIVHIPNEDYSFEIKTSSSKNDIYGNRSYAQPKSKAGKKAKDGYYLAINFSKRTKGKLPEITKIRFGWLDHSDWIPQKSPTGQQCRLTIESKKYKLITLYSNNGS